jgi:DNA polymerase-4
MQRVILHVDMDAFFASVEQRDFPELQGTPVIVGAAPNRRGVVCAASYEARRFHVRSAMPSRTAAKLCPQGVFLPPRMDVYRKESALLMDLLEKHSPCVERVSVDEAYLDLSERCNPAPGPDAALENALPIARSIQESIQSERNLPCSIGIASNKFLAKLASDFQKPRGLTLIPESLKIEFLRPLPVGSIHGVGPVTAQALESQGILTIGDLQSSSLPLESVVGRWAESLRQRAFGEDYRPLQPDRERKSISAENTFPSDTADRHTLRNALKEMASDVAQSLEKRQLGALTLAVKVRYSDFTTLTRQIRSQDPITSAREIYRIACGLLHVHTLVHRPLRLLGVGVSTLTAPQSPQLRLPC